MYASENLQGLFSSSGDGGKARAEALIADYQSRYQQWADAQDVYLRERGYIDERTFIRESWFDPQIGYPVSGLAVGTRVSMNTPAGLIHGIVVWDAVKFRTIAVPLDTKVYLSAPDNPRPPFVSHQVIVSPESDKPLPSPAEGGAIPPPPGAPVPIAGDPALKWLIPAAGTVALLAFL